MSTKLFIVVDPKDDGPWPLYQGVFGAVAENNVYLTAYAQYPDERRPMSLAKGETIHGVVFRLSGERGVYHIRRVE